MLRFASVRSVVPIAFGALLALTSVFYIVTLTSVRDLGTALNLVSSPWNRVAQRPRRARLVTDPLERAQLVNRCWRGYTQHRDRVLPRWQAARQLLGLPPAESIAADDGTSNFRWNGTACVQSPRRAFRDRCANSFLPMFHSFHAGTEVRNVRNVSERFGYVRIWKCGNDAVRFNLERIYGGKRSLRHVTAPVCDERWIWQFRIANSVRDDSVGEPGSAMAQRGSSRSNFTFTFTRHPIERFISAYSEVEMRLVSMWRYRRTIEAEGWRWIKMPRGTTQRVHAFVLDLLECRPTGRGSQTMHMYPQVGGLLPRELDFVGDVSNATNGGSFNKNWEQMWSFMPPPPPPPPPLPAAPAEAEASDDVAHTAAPEGHNATLTQFNTMLGKHWSSRDPFGTTAAAHRLLAANPNVVRALCHMYHFDFECLGYAKPPECDVDDVGDGDSENDNGDRA